LCYTSTITGLTSAQTSAGAACTGCGGSTTIYVNSSDQVYSDSGCSNSIANRYYGFDSGGCKYYYVNFSGILTGPFDCE
jgi:hypothetical protein